MSVVLINDGTVKPEDIADTIEGLLHAKFSGRDGK